MIITIQTNNKNIKEEYDSKLSDEDDPSDHATPKRKHEKKQKLED